MATRVLTRAHFLVQEHAEIIARSYNHRLEERARARLTACVTAGSSMALFFQTATVSTMPFIAASLFAGMSIGLAWSARDKSAELSEKRPFCRLRNKDGTPYLEELAVPSPSHAWENLTHFLPADYDANTMDVEKEALKLIAALNPRVKVDLE